MVFWGTGYWVLGISWDINPSFVDHGSVKAVKQKPHAQHHVGQIQHGDHHGRKGGASEVFHHHKAAGYNEQSQEN